MSFIGRCKYLVPTGRRCRNMRVLGPYCDFHAAVVTGEISVRETRAMAKVIEALHDEMLAERPTTTTRASA